MRRAERPSRPGTGCATARRNKPRLVWRVRTGPAPGRPRPAPLTTPAGARAAMYPCASHWRLPHQPSAHSPHNGVVEVRRDLVRPVRSVAPLNLADRTATRHEVGQAALVSLAGHERLGDLGFVAPAEGPQERDALLLLAAVVDRVERDRRIVAAVRPDLPDRLDP